MQNFEFDKFCDEMFGEFEKLLTDEVANFPKTLEAGQIVNLEPEKIRSMMERPSELRINEDGKLYFIDQQGEEVVIDVRTNDSDIQSKQFSRVCEVLPDCPFDLHCGGIKRKQNEAIAVYKIALVDAFVNGKYSDDIKEVVDSYDFKNYKSGDAGGKNFSDLLKQIQEDATPTMKFLLSCASILIVNTKEKNEAPYIGIVSQEDQEVLESMTRYISTLEFQCNNSVKNLSSRLERLSIINEKDQAIQSYISNKGKRISVYYRLSKWNVDDLDQEIVSGIKQTARKISRNALLENKLPNSDYQKKFIERLSKRALQRVIRHVQNELFTEASSRNEDQLDELIKRF